MSRHERERSDRQDLVLANPGDLDRLRAALQNHGLPLGVLVGYEFARALDQALVFRRVNQGPAEIFDRHVPDLILVVLRHDDATAHLVEAFPGEVSKIASAHGRPRFCPTLRNVALLRIRRGGTGGIPGSSPSSE
jgi:hypothetical protein